MIDIKIHLSDLWPVWEKWKISHLPSLPCKVNPSNSRALFLQDNIHDYPVMIDGAGWSCFLCQADNVGNCIISITTSYIYLYENKYLFIRLPWQHIKWVFIPNLAHNNIWTSYYYQLWYIHIWAAWSIMHILLSLYSLYF